MERWIWAGSLITAAVICGFLFWRQKRKYEEDLEFAVKLLEQITSEEAALQFTECDDLLLSKLQHRIHRIKDMMDSSREKAERDKDSIRKLILEIAHQLRMPLANMEAYLELIKDDMDSTSDARYITALETSEKQLSFLVESFIKMSRLETNVIQLQKQEQDICETILDAVGKISRRAEEKRIRIDLNAGAGFCIDHDRNWMSEAIFNILDNSVKYSPADSRISIELTKNKMFLQIRIRDRGIGIETGEEHEIFQRFYRGKNVGNREGLGLGLYITREIIEAHSGLIKVNREDPGTSFCILIGMLS